MESKVDIKDFSVEVSGAIDETIVAWLHEAASEITSQAQRTCAMEDDAGKRLKGSYANHVDESGGKASIGTPLEEGYWEEWGTGSYAAHGDGRKGWWVYVKGNGVSAKASTTYQSQDEAEAVAASMRAAGLDAYATNGREPHYTLERSFEAKANWAKGRLADMMKERMEK